jgi:hypothetical protein
MSPHRRRRCPGRPRSSSCPEHIRPGTRSCRSWLRTLDCRSRRGFQTDRSRTTGARCPSTEWSRPCRRPSTARWYTRRWRTRRRRPSCRSRRRSGGRCPCIERRPARMRPCTTPSRPWRRRFDWCKRPSFPSCRSRCRSGRRSRSTAYRPERRRRYSRPTHRPGCRNPSARPTGPSSRKSRRRCPSTGSPPRNTGRRCRARRPSCPRRATRRGSRPGLRRRRPPWRRSRERWNRPAPAVWIRLPLRCCSRSLSRPPRRPRPRW